MRLSAFLVISITLHAAVLSYPIVSLSPQAQDLIPVVVVSLREQEVTGAPRAGVQQSKPLEKKRFASGRQTEERATAEKESPPEPKDLGGLNLSSTDTATGIPIASAVGPPAEVFATFSTHLGKGSGGDDDSGGQGNSGTGTGTGINGNGTGGSKFVQVSYAHSPTPKYPEEARREGKEGRVLLRVLVDEQGRSKSAEVNQSSGSEALDRAAVEAIRSWRFSPARYGDIPVENWVKIPIDFRLTDAKY
ncbi:MAG TPA: energy transducer TonB [Candidatus Binatia bacterium]|nr:energy transducer TonB [Candidatus Binatia bacterium]